MENPPDAADAKSGIELEPDSDGIDLAERQESSIAQTCETSTRERIERGIVLAESEADVILIAHPESQRLGSRYRLSPGTLLEIGPSPLVGLSLPEAMAISRKHAWLPFAGTGSFMRDPGPPQAALFKRH